MTDIAPEKTVTLSEDPKIPEIIYVNLQPRFASLVFTVPNLNTNLPENPSFDPKGNLSVRLKNNDRFKVDQSSSMGMRRNDWNRNTIMETVNWDGEIIRGNDLLKRRAELLEKFFVKMLGGEEAVRHLRGEMERLGLKEGNYLYCAVSAAETLKIQGDGAAFYSHLDPSANFENEKMYTHDFSQVRYYAKRKIDGYSGEIIRWQIEHPLLYRLTGFAPQRVVPMFSHYLPQKLEISSDGGKTFTPFFKDKA